MKPYPYLLLLFVCLYNIALTQDGPHRLFLRTGTIEPQRLSKDQLLYFDNNTSPVAGQRFGILQFESIPDASQRKKLEETGIVLLDYIPSSAYLASISKPLTMEMLKRVQVRSILPVDPALKISNGLSELLINQQGTDVMIAYFRTVPFDTVERHLAEHGCTIIDSDAKVHQVISVKLPGGKLGDLAALPFIQYIDKVPPPPVALNWESKNQTRANVLHSTLPGDYNLTGEGITMGIAEPVTPPPYPHIDFVDRLAQGSPVEDGYHATHVFGIAAGAGNVFERYKGYAPRSKIIGSQSSFTYTFMPRLVNDSGMIMANHSFGGGLSCQVINIMTSYTVDKTALDFPKYLGIFAAGNFGTSNCGDGYPPGFGTVVAGANSTKNILSVGNTTTDGILVAGSSKGPAYGGRIKPDITAPGYTIISTIGSNHYGSNSGTSMAAPAAMGGLALLNQRYRQLHNNEIPDAGLMKAIICNTATDMGNAGPDFSYGFGDMNLLRAVRSLDHHWFFTDSISNDGQKQHTIDVPTGTKQLKVFLYWHDAPATALSSKMLIHDLDLQVTPPSGTTVLPWTLDTLRTNLTLPATRAEEHYNNAEQITIDEPATGTYTIKVRGTEIGQSDKQTYYISYDIIDGKVELTYPSGGEGLIPGETISIRWEDFSGNTSSYTLEFSRDNGSSWQSISSSVAATARTYQWVVPSFVTANGLIRITRNNGEGQNTSRSFVIIDVPQVSLAPVQCPGYIRMQWTAVSNANDYEVFMVKNGQMEPVGTTTNTTYTFSNLSQETTYWVSVRARINGKAGLRATAIFRKPDSGSCSGDISDGDLQMVEIVSPVAGRRLTSTQLNNNEVIKLRVRNLDDQPSGNFTVAFNINNTGWISENITTPIPAGSFYEHSFSGSYDFSAPGSYFIKTAVTGNADNNRFNDSVNNLIRQLDNLPIAIPFTDSFMTAVPGEYHKTLSGLEGADRYDYYKEPGNGKLWYGPTVYPDGFTARPGFKFGNGVVLNNHHQFIGTYNLAAYDTAAHNIVLQFTHTNGLGPSHKVFIRGNDTLPWLLAYESANVLVQAIDRDSPPLNLGSLLRNAGQTFSPSFQVSFDQRNSNQQWSIAEINLINASRDVELASIDSIKLQSCDMSNAVPVYVKVINYGRQTVTNLHVKYKINGGAIVDEIIPQLLPDSSLNYKFAARADLSVPGMYVIESWIENPGDTYPENNSKSITAYRQPVINTFPYLQDFEKDNGNWYSQGTNSSWQYGVPASTKISGAASGQKAWKTNLTGLHNTRENGFLYSPCFDLTSLQRPMISFSLSLNSELCIPTGICDFINLTYSADGGRTWLPFSRTYSYYNWEPSWTGENNWRWKVVTNILPDSPQVQLRFNFRSNNRINYEGAAVDDIHIYDSIGYIYDGPTTASPVEKNIAASNSWVHFIKDDKIIASVNSFGQDLGSAKATVFVNQGATRNFHGQYYLNRNWLLSSQNKPADSIGIRLYFRDSESDSLLFAKNCPACTKPPHPYRFGVSAYHTDSLPEYNNSILDNYSGEWKFLDRSRVKMVPFDNGYYAEFKVKDLSEFWLNDGGLDDKSYLPVHFLQFDISKISNADALLKWSTATEINIHHFDIEVAKGNAAFNQNSYVKIGEVLSAGQSVQPQLYNYTDVQGNKTGVYYYRVKAVDEFGNYVYSRSQPIIWTDELQWTVYPNPSPGGLFNLRYQAESNEVVWINIYNSAGALLRQQQVKGNGFVENLVIDMSKYATGLYFLHANTGRQSISLKMVKH